MVEFKAVIADPKSGKSYNAPVSGPQANSLIGKRVGEQIDGIFVGLPGYKLIITGGSDKDGFPMRPEIPGGLRKKVLVTEGVGFRPKDRGVRRRRTLRGNAISPDTLQLNLKVVSRGPKPVEEALAEGEGS